MRPNLPGGPIPITLLVEANSFFDKVLYDELLDHRREYIVDIYWDQKSKKYVLCVPDQGLSKELSLSFNSGINSNYEQVCRLHSHNWMAPYFSESDVFDLNIFYGVIGHATKHTKQQLFAYYDPNRVEIQRVVLVRCDEIFESGFIIE